LIGLLLQAFYLPWREASRRGKKKPATIDLPQA
jgi:hypothetical protein